MTPLEGAVERPEFASLDLDVDTDEVHRHIEEAMKGSHVGNERGSEIPENGWDAGRYRRLTTGRQWRRESNTRLSDSASTGIRDSKGVKDSGRAATARHQSVTGFATYPCRQSPVEQNLTDAVVTQGPDLHIRAMGPPERWAPEILYQRRSTRLPSHRTSHNSTSNLRGTVKCGLSRTVAGLSRQFWACDSRNHRPESADRHDPVSGCQIIYETVGVVAPTADTSSFTLGVYRVAIVYENILLPTDGSDGTGQVLEHALQIARLNGATLYVLHVVDTSVVPLDAHSQAVYDEMES